MSRFPESLKRKIRRLADMRCCMSDCHKLGVDIHHIKPISEGGDNTFDNAAPLCAGCHRNHGMDPTKRKMIRECRDNWYKSVSGHGPGSVVRASPCRSLEDCAYSFVRSELIHPLIVRDLLGYNYLLDGPSIVAIDLASANHSDRYFGKIDSRHDENGRLVVSWHDENEKQHRPESFTYSRIATSHSGIEMVQCWDNGGGSSTFCGIGLFCFEVDRGVDEHTSPVEENVTTLERPIIRSLGSISLGDRYKGNIVYEDGMLSIGPDVGRYKTAIRAARAVAVP